MEYKFFHDSEQKIVYRMPMQPNIIEQRKSKKFIGWLISMEIVLTRADNILVNNHWKYPCGEYPQQDFGARYTKEEALSYFYDRHTPKCEEINQVTYQSLTAKYESIAQSNRI